MESRNRGNLLEFLDFLEMTCPGLAADVAKLPRNGQDTHHPTQNKLLGVYDELALRTIHSEV